MTYYNDLREFYAKYDAEDAYERRWGYGNPVAADYWRLRDQLVFAAISGHFRAFLSQVRVLEVGTGHGHELAKLRSLGIPDQNLVGIDLLESRLNWARGAYPTIDFQTEDATALSFPDESFDLVMQFTCVMHAPTKEIQQAICHEMARVLRPGGLILWWDVAPICWRTVLLRRLYNIFASRSRFRSALGGIVRTCREALRPSARRHAIEQGNVSHALTTSSEEVAKMFAPLKSHAVCAGLDFGVWEIMWQRQRALASALWRKGWFAQHCFAMIKKL